MTARHVRQGRRMLTAALTLALALAAIGASAAPMAMTLDTADVLVGEDGQALTQPGQYDSIYQLGFGAGGEDGPVCFAAAGDDGKYALLGEDGARLTDFAYDSLDLTGGAVVFYQGDRVGAMNPDGQPLIPADYTMLLPTGEGSFLALRTDPYDDAADGVYLVDAQGDEKATGAKILYGLGALNDGLIPATSSQDGKSGYLNAQGQWTIEPQYTYCGPFMGGFAEASGASGSGIINVKGNWVVTPKYVSAGVGYPEVGAPFVAIDASGLLTLISSANFKVIKTFRGESVWGYALDNGLVAVSSSGKSTVLDYAGNALFKLDVGYDVNAWDSALDVVVVTHGDWGTANTWLYDMKGKPVVGPYQGLSRVGTLDGVAVFTFERFDVVETESSSGSTYYTMRAGTYRVGLVDANGDVLIDAIYDSLYPMGDGFLRAETPEFYAMIDYHGEALAHFDRYENLVD